MPGAGESGSFCWRVMGAGPGDAERLDSRQPERQEGTTEFMSRANEAHNDLLEAAKGLCLKLGLVQEDDEGLLVDTQQFDPEGDDDDLREAIEKLMERESESVEAFEGDVDLAVDYIKEVIQDASEGDS